MSLIHTTQQDILYKFKMANQPNVTSEAGTPKLTALSIGSLTLDPFDEDVNEYVTETENILIQLQLRSSRH